MGKAEIIAELETLSREDHAEIRSKLDELAGFGEDVWIDNGELSEEDKRLLSDRLAELEKNPDAGSPWDVVEARIRAKLKP